MLSSNIFAVGEKYSKKISFRFSYIEIIDHMLVEMYSQDVKNKDSLKVYLIDDELETLNAYERFCTRSGFEAECFVQPEAFLKRYASIDRSQTHVVISDMSMPKMLGLELMEKLSEINPDVIVLFLTGNRDVSSAVEAMKKGAFDYLVKSPNFDEFSVRLKRAFGAHEAKLDSKILESQAFQLNSFFGIQGQSLAVKNLFSKLRKVIDAQSPVLLIGPSGSGKFKVAESLHNRGAKSGGEFIVHSFASSPENSFVKEGRDLFVRASGGTLFLDSIDKMMEAEQIVVLQLIKSFSETQIRIISSSGVNLGKLGQPENFNQELFYLLSVFPIDIPSLKERSEDIPMLALDFLRAAARAWGRPCRKFSKAAQKLLVNHSWPGNLKELESTVERAVALSEGREIPAENIQFASIDLQDQFSWLDDLHRLPTLKEFEVEFIREALKRSRGHKEKAAKMLGIGRKTLYRKELEMKLGDDKYVNA